MEWLAIGALSYAAWRLHNRVRYLEKKMHELEFPLG